MPSPITSSHPHSPWTSELRHTHSADPPGQPPDPPLLLSHLSLLPRPLQSPSSSSAHILLLGGGVSSLMTSWHLLDRGYRVTILSTSWSTSTSRAVVPGAGHGSLSKPITSQIAAALWEYPPGGCGLTEIETKDDVYSDVATYRRWALESFRFYQELAELPQGGEFGVMMRELVQFFMGELGKNEEKREEITGLGIGYEGFDEKGIKRVIKELGVGGDIAEKVKKGYRHKSPVVDSDQAMRFLMELVEGKGGRLVAREVTSLEEARREYAADVVVNCTGLSSATLVRDESVYPVRGAVIRVVNKDRGSFRKVTEAMLVPSQETEGFEGVILIVPRSENTLQVGSIVQENEWELDLTMESPEVKEMWDRAVRFLPGLKDAQIEGLAQGLRPFSRKNVRVKREGWMVHNYGHGGSGWTLAVGCAKEAAGLVEEVIRENKERDNRAKL
ncbi:nucleotide-binding domain-containing protein [Pyronema domesticum]|uniref:Similar to D-aspartate oxidase acc. no. Q556W1 n=1 Tax=Pyronema omphalodes (strain CBS 100304) TaxID=1076935 RepID=U4LFG2_PYROM|nr:nucleotide-binding domain-containing protein [Pyronema domesticum]CCX30628.1 Similar to D-aspartate oxidase; acc. no. Q556W1 [Pyronema omphalodes CBS 100304]